MTSNTKALGQYFTVSESLQTAVFDLVRHRGARLLEPSMGAGHLLLPFKRADPNYPMTCYELDQTIQQVVEFNDHQTLTYGDFTTQTIIERYKTIVANPPYVKRRDGNLYIQFISLCYRLLDDDGEMIFIVPSDFLKCTRASDLRTEMLATGSFTDVVLPHDETLFAGASIDVMIFRYARGPTASTTRVNGEERWCHVHQSIVTFSDCEVRGVPLTNRFRAYVGLVSGLDAVYRSELGTMDILQDKDRVERFIFPETFPTPTPELNEYLLARKDALLTRKIKSFSELNWFLWGAPRNITTIRSQWGVPCIYVRTVTRKSEVAFRGHVQYFGGSLICLVPIQPLTDAELDLVVEHMNTPVFQQPYTYAGRFKIGHKQLSAACIPT